MRKLAILAFLATVLAPAALADNPSGQTQNQSPAQQCKAQRTALGTSTFNQTYGTSTTDKQAFSKCIAKQTKNDAKQESDAEAACKAEQAKDATAFATKYGNGKTHGNSAFAKCVSQKSQQAETKDQQATINAARTCRKEQTSGVSTFTTKYGSNANHANAFGKCVSAHSKAKH